MTTSINDILQFSSIDLNTFEVRGIKYGVNNATTTAPVFSRVTPYVPSKCVVAAHVTTLSGSDNVTINSFDAYPFMDTSSLKLNDKITLNSSDYLIIAITGPYSVQVDVVVPTTELNVSAVISLNQRDYVIEPDVNYNTSIGTASFVHNDSTVYGISTSGLAAGYFIKSNSYQKYYKVKGIINASTLGLVSPYLGSTSIAEDYTAKKWLIGQTDVRYSKDNINYDNQSGKWTYSSITGFNKPTSTVYSSFADGIELQYNHSMDPNAPDIMDVATITNKVLSSKTQYDSPQYALPVVPYSETMSLYINDKLRDQFPGGNKDYVLNFSQSPVYTPPPPPDKRKVANIMFLSGIKDVKPASSITSEGQWYLADQSGNTISDIMPGSESLKLNGVDQTAYKDYVLESSSGLMEAIKSVIDEPVVKYVGTNFGQYIDYGFEIYLNGVKQRISFPSNPTDQVIFQPSSGYMKPADQDHPGPEDVYEIQYMTSSAASVTDNFSVGVGVSSISTQLFPIKQNSLFVQSSYNDGVKQRSNILTENTDFYVSYLTGKIFLSSPTAYNTSFSVIYTPLSKQVNELTYSDGTSYCMVYNSRLSVSDAQTFQFQLSNPLASINQIFRIYNETRNADYEISGFNKKADKIWIDPTPQNLSIGLSNSDVVTIDYNLISESVEYTPVEINYLNIVEGTNKIYLEGVNIGSLVMPGSLVNVSLPDSATQFFSTVTTCTFDGTGSVINLSTQIPQSVTNPGLYISDASVSFVPLSAKAEPFISGSLQLTFKKQNILNFLRPQSVLSVGGDYYQIVSASLDLSDTLVSLNSGALKDYTSTSVLTSIRISDVPVYNEGQTIIYPSMPIVDQMNQNAFIMNNNGSSKVLSVVSDASAISIDGTSLLYAYNPTLGDLSSAFSYLGISSLSMVSYVPFWQSNKIISTNASIYAGSNTLMYANSALRHNTLDSTDFSQTGGYITLSNPLVSGDRYNLDYMGRKFLNDTTVIYSFSHFVNLAAGSKVSASFQYQNLDQFYAQVLSQKDFIQSVTQPRMAEEANQLNGSVGQGGQVAGDGDTQPSSGGLYGDYYRKQDAEIESRAFKVIYDFFQDRLVNYSDELQYSTGLKLFNNDGTFSNEQQIGSTLSVSRIFPMNYTKMEPRRCNPLTGFFFNTGAYFVNGSNQVYNRFGWSPVLVNGSLIGRADSSKYYTVDVVINPNTIQLDRTFEEVSSKSSSGEKYMAAGLLPIYDDDGYLGPKQISTSSEIDGFGLSSGDAFTCTIDSSFCTYIFQDLPFPYSLFQPAVSDLNAAQIASNLTTGIPGLKATVETIPDFTEPYGYRTSIVLRTTDTLNYLQMGSGPAVSKLGFIPGTVATGNYNRSVYTPELFYDSTERSILGTGYGTEQYYLGLMLGESNKLNRNNHLSDVSSCILQEMAQILQEIPKITSIINATNNLIQESNISTYSDCSTSHYNATVALTNANYSYSYDSSYYAMDWVWPIDYENRLSTITGINGSLSFNLGVPTDNDRRILNAPVVRFTDGSVVGGSWYNHPSMTPLSTYPGYSTDSTAIFQMDTTVVFTLSHGPAAYNVGYSISTSNLILYWAVDGTYYNKTISLLIPYSDINYVVGQVNTTGDVTATVNPLCANYYPSLKIDSSTVNPTADIYYGLRDVNVTFETISDRLLTYRIDFNNDRYNYLNNTRIPYLLSRENQIGTDLISEELLRVSSGEPGNLYAWANNLYNRRQGSYARASQIQAQINSNQSALNINKSFI